MKYYIFFNLVNGRDVRATLTIDPPINRHIESEEIRQRLADSLMKEEYWHFYENDKLVIINMANVAYIRVTKAE